MIIACDFDGTLTDKNIFPDIGPMKEHAIAALKNLQCHGHKIILWTCREGKYLEDAVNALQWSQPYSRFFLKADKSVRDIWDFGRIEISKVIGG